MQIGCDCFPDTIQIIILFANMALLRTPAVGSLVSKPVRIVFGTVWVLFYPLIYVLQEAHIRAHERQDGYIRTDLKPRSIHRRFKKRRSLSFGNESQKFEEKRCRLLALPREVRDIIWKEAMGRMAFCLWISGGKFMGCRNYLSDTESQMNYFRGIPQYEIGCGILGLLQSCKQV